MPRTAFVDEELIQMTKNSKSNVKLDEYEDWRYLASCLTIGLSLDDLQQLQYKDVAKIMYVMMEDSKEKKTRTATQADINKLLR